MSGNFQEGATLNTILKNIFYFTVLCFGGGGEVGGWGRGMYEVGAVVLALETGKSGPPTYRRSCKLSNLSRIGNHCYCSHMASFWHLGNPARRLTVLCNNMSVFT